mgnify:CR=1 FL=1
MDPSKAYLTVFNSTPHERKLAVLLGVPLNGCDPLLAHLGTKSGSRKVFREAGVPLPEGFEDLHTPHDVESALEELRARLPRFLELASESDRWLVDAVGAGDLRRLHCPFGGEPVLKGTVDEFVSRFSACGVSAGSFQNCYAMAENTFAMTSTREGPIRFLGVDQELFRKEHRVRPSAEGRPVASAGVPLANGFLSKEMFFAETFQVQWLGPWYWIMPVAATLAGIFTVAYSTRFVHDVFFGPAPQGLPKTPHEPPRWMKVPVEILVGLCLLVGLTPAITVDPLLRAAAGAVLQGPLPDYSLKLWHGFNLPLLMSAIAVGGGAALYFGLSSGGRLHRYLPGAFSGKGVFTGGVDRLFAVTVGTGIGGGVVINGRLHAGPEDLAGEIGIFQQRCRTERGEQPGNGCERVRDELQAGLPGMADAGRGCLGRRIMA